MRYELKMLCPGTQVAQLHLWMQLHPAGLRTAYPARWVNSLYFDTYQFSALTDNLDGVALRNKLRLRWYGDVQPAVQPILELKHKRGLVGMKEQVVLARDVNLSDRWCAILSRVRDGLPPLWASRFQTTTQPVLLNRYWREYYLTADRTVRVTLDSRQVAYEQRLAARPNLRIPLPIDDLLVIEIKADQTYVDRVQAVANAFPICRTRNSKYARGMLASLYSP